MQGICGFLHLDRQPASPATLSAMRTTLVRTAWTRHDSWHEGSIAMAAAHWAVAEQPNAPTLMHRDPDSGCVAIADSRLQEKAALARTLGLRADEAASATDARLILQAWLRWGPDCVDHLDGDFAFAVWDPRHARLFLARDAMGVRPLLVHYARGRLLAFASSEPAVLAHPGVPFTLNEGRIADFLVNQLEGVDKTSTFHSHVERLPPGHVLELAGEALRQHRYWSTADLPSDDVSRSDDEWAEALTDVLERSVASHLASGERVGCMLSGGMDSSSLAIIAAQQMAARGTGPLRTFSSIDSGHPDCAETRAIRAMLQLPGFAPSLVDRADDHGTAKQLLPYLLSDENPFDEGMTLIHAQYLAAAAGGIDAVIDGIDGDTLFSEGGTISRQIRAGQLTGAWRNLQGEKRMYGGRSLAVQFLRESARALAPEMLRAGLGRIRRTQLPRLALTKSLISPEFAQRVQLDERLARLKALRSRQRHTRGEAREALDHPYTTVGVERYHRVAAEHGISPRHPFLDRRVLAVGVNLPDSQRMSGGWSKIVLRRATRSRLPDSVRWRSDKQHIGWALTRHVFEMDRARLLLQLDHQRPLLAPYLDLERLDAVARRLDEPGDHGMAAHALLGAVQLGHWLDQEHNRPVRPERPPATRSVTDQL